MQWLLSGGAAGVQTRQWNPSHAHHSSLIHFLPCRPSPVPLLAAGHEILNQTISSSISSCLCVADAAWTALAFLSTLCAYLKPAKAKTSFRWNGRWRLRRHRAAGTAWFLSFWHIWWAGLLIWPLEGLMKLIVQHTLRISDQVWLKVYSSCMTPQLWRLLFSSQMCIKIKLQKKK